MSGMVVRVEENLQYLHKDRTQKGAKKTWIVSLRRMSNLPGKSGGQEQHGGKNAPALFTMVVFRWP